MYAKQQATVIQIQCADRQLLLLIRVHIGAAGDGAAAGEDMWDEFAEKAKRQEEELQKQKEEEEQVSRGLVMLQAV